MTDDKLRAALDLFEQSDREQNVHKFRQGMDVLRAALAASATDEPVFAFDEANALRDASATDEGYWERAIAAGTHRPAVDDFGNRYLAASATDEGLTPLEMASLGICPVCDNRFRDDGHSFDCPLAARPAVPALDVVAAMVRDANEWWRDPENRERDLPWAPKSEHILALSGRQP